MEITDQILDDYRGYFNGQFSDAQKWPDNLLKEILCRADSETGGSGWGSFRLDCHNFKRYGMYLYAAAFLTNFYGDNPANGIASEAHLNTAAKSVGDESIQYRVASMMDAGNDFLTYTAYGQEFFRVRRRASMGARAV